jgi:hypothetical protein
MAQALKFGSASRTPIEELEKAGYEPEATKR